MSYRFLPLLIIGKFPKAHALTGVGAGLGAEHDESFPHRWAGEPFRGSKATKGSIRMFNVGGRCRGSLVLARVLASLPHRPGHITGSSPDARRARTAARPWQAHTAISTRGLRRAGSGAGVKDTVSG